MTLPNFFTAGARARAAESRGDGSVALILFLLFALVFAPVIGLHVALAAVAPTAAPAAAGEPAVSTPAR
jgi:hypothetical protein